MNVSQIYQLHSICVVGHKTRIQFGFCGNSLLLFFINLAPNAADSLVFTIPLNFERVGFIVVLQELQVLSFGRVEKDVFQS